MAGKKKILYVVTKSAPWGGAQKYVYDLITHLPRAWEAAVVLGGDGPLKERLDEAGVRTIQIKAFQRDINIWKECRVLIELVRILRHERPAVVHVNSSKAGGLGALAARLARVPNVVFTAHGWTFTEPRGWFARSLIAFFSWLTVCFSHITITVSHYHRTKARWMPGVQKKLHTVHNGVESAEGFEKTVARQQIAEYAHIPDGVWQHKMWVGTVSELHCNKGLPYLIYAAQTVLEQYPNMIVVIVGEGEERAHLEEIIDRLSLRGSIFFAGNVPDAALYLKAFDIFTLTSLKEGLPYSILEAGQAGVPVIASGIDGIPEIIADMESGMLIKPKRPDEIGEALLYLLKHPEKRGEFGAALQKRVARDFSEEAMIRKTVAHYGND
jgi:glycosyltransferase involved in cell wall biosynthesis